MTAVEYQLNNKIANVFDHLTDNMHLTFNETSTLFVLKENQCIKLYPPAYFIIELENKQYGHGRPYFRIPILSIIHKPKTLKYKIILKYIKNNERHELYSEMKKIKITTFILNSINSRKREDEAELKLKSKFPDKIMQIDEALSRYYKTFGI
eukprot:58269_1